MPHIFTTLIQPCILILDSCTQLLNFTPPFVNSLGIPHVTYSKLNSSIIIMIPTWPSNLFFSSIFFHNKCHYNLPKCSSQSLYCLAWFFFTHHLPISKCCNSYLHGTSSIGFPLSSPASPGLSSITSCLNHRWSLSSCYSSWFPTCSLSICFSHRM